MRTTIREINSHIHFIERFTDYRIERDYSATKRTYNVCLNDKVVATIISDNNSDVWDMLNPFWEIGFENSKKEYESR